MWTIIDDGKTYECPNERMHLLIMCVLAENTSCRQLTMVRDTGSIRIFANGKCCWQATAQVVRHPVGDRIVATA